MLSAINHSNGRKDIDADEKRRTELPESVIDRQKINLLRDLGIERTFQQNPVDVPQSNQSLNTVSFECLELSILNTYTRPFLSQKCHKQNVSKLVKF